MESSEVLGVIEKITKKIAPGRAPSFNEANVLKTLEIIDAYVTIGRIKLSKELGLGEGVTRTLLKHLKKEGLIKGLKQGTALSAYGKKLLSDLKSKITQGIPVQQSKLTVGPFNVAVLVRNAAKSVRFGIEQRDAAIKAGALGATTLIFSNNRLIMPSSEEYPFRGTLSLHNMLVSKLDPKEEDVILIGSGESKASAEIGAKMAALNLLKKRRNLRQKC